MKQELHVDRRSALRLAGLGAASALAGCLDVGGDGDGTPTDMPAESPTGTPGGSGTSIAAQSTMRLAVRSSAPIWYRDGDDGPTGHAVVVDSESRQRGALDGYDVPEEREAELEEFLAGLDYETDRLVLLESVGPDTCHDRLDIADVRVADDTLRADASVVDTSEAGESCGDAITVPSSLLAVTFDGDPLGEVTVAFTDGWDETETVRAGVDDPLPSLDPEELPGHVRPDADPEPVAPLSCDEDGVHRHPQGYEEGAVQWGDYAESGNEEPELALRVDDTEYGYGDVVTVTLTNVTGREAHTGNRTKYTLQVHTEDGWQDVRVKGDEFWEYEDDAVAHPPGEGFEWEFELTESGIVEGVYHDDAEVCPDLQPGRYRFAYFGVIGDRAVAASFDLVS